MAEWMTFQGSWIARLKVHPSQTYGSRIVWLIHHYSYTEWKWSPILSPTNYFICPLKWSIRRMRHGRWFGTMIHLECECIEDDEACVMKTPKDDWNAGGDPFPRIKTLKCPEPNAKGKFYEHNQTSHALHQGPAINYMLAGMFSVIFSFSIITISWSKSREKPMGFPQTQDVPLKGTLKFHIGPGLLLFQKKKSVTKGLCIMNSRFHGKYQKKIRATT